MSGGRVRKLTIIVILVGVATAIVRALRGDPAPQFANHPTVHGGSPARPMAPAAAGTSSSPTPQADTPPADTAPADTPPADTAPADTPPADTAPAAAPEATTGPVAELAAPEGPVAELEAPEGPVAELAAPEPVLELEAHQQPASEVEAPSWVEPHDGACPDGFPVKAKLKSGIYHLPGGLAYERTKPDRCYPSAEAAAADGLRPPKR